jgi:hypothetical protein
MGIWRQGSFANDGAMDWVAELSAHGIEAIRKALQLPDGYIPMDQAQAAIAAAEVIAAVHGETSDDTPTEVKTWIKENAALVVSDTEVASAIASVVRVREASELQEVWLEGPRAELWLRATSDLVKRLETVVRVRLK